MKNIINYQKGSTQTAIMALVILIVFLLAGSLLYYDYSREPLAVETERTLPGYTTTTSTTTLETVYKPAHTVIRTLPASPFPGGPVYPNATYDLTVNLPATYQGYSVSIGQDAYTGISDTASIHFTALNGNSFTINVFSMEQWNKIRTIENAAHQNVNSFGEGDYLGENFRFIYSSYGNEPQLQSILDQIRFN